MFRSRSEIAKQCLLVALMILVSVLVVLTSRSAAAYVRSIDNSHLDVGQLTTFAHYTQAALILVFSLILGVFIHRFPEPFFIFWFFGWLSWLGLYLCRALGLTWGEIFNPLNSYFFLAAGLDLLAPPSWSARLRRYPESPTRRFGSPALWLLRYYRSNLSATAVLLTVGGVLSFKLLSSSAYRFSEDAYSVVAISLLAIGLYRRMALVSSDGAVLALFVYAIYLEPPLSKLTWVSATSGTVDSLVAIVAPTLVLKPVLALFVVLLALRETAARKEIAERNIESYGASILEQLPDACMLTRDKLITFVNPRGRQLLGIKSVEPIPLESLFASPQSCAQFMETLHRSKDGRILGYSTELMIATDRAATIRPRLWVRLDAFYRTHRSAEQRLSEDVVILILDRHELELTNAVFLLAHDYIRPRLRQLAGALRQRFAELRSAASLGADAAPIGERELELCSEVLQATDLLKQEFRGYWLKISGAADLSPQSADAATCIARAWAQAKRTCSADEPLMIELHVKYFPDKDQFLLDVDEKSLVRALQNAFTNAIQATMRRQPTMQLPPTAVHVNATDQWVTIWIRDHGEGFSNDILTFMNESETPGPPPNVGIGLISLRITVARAGGMVRIGNFIDRSGAYLEITLPRVSSRK